MRKLLALLFITPLSIAACAPEDVGIVTPEDPGDTNPPATPETPEDTTPDTPEDTTPDEEPEEEFVPETPTIPEEEQEADPADHSGVEGFQGMNFDVSASLPDYLIATPTESISTNWDSTWAPDTLNGITAPFIQETYDEVQTLDFYQSTINGLNEIIYNNRPTISTVIPQVPIISGNLQVWSTLIIDNPFGGDNGVGYKSTIKVNTPSVTGVNLELLTFYEEKEDEGVSCTHSRIQADAKMFVFNVGSVNSLITSCYETDSKEWINTYMVNNARVGYNFLGADIYNSLTELTNTTEGINLATRRKIVGSSEYRRFVKVQNGQSYEYSYKEGGWFTNGVEQFTATDDQGNLIFSTEVKDNGDFDSKWYMAGLDGWDEASYNANFWGNDDMKIVFSNGNTHQYDSGDWGDKDDEYNYFMNGKDEIEQWIIDGDDYKSQGVLYPYLDVRESHGWSDPFSVPSDFEGSSTWESSISSLREQAKTDYDNYEFMGQPVLEGGFGVKDLVDSVLKRISWT